jgi:uncharacterized repeat protein (TIGR03803 family)
MSKSRAFWPPVLVVAVSSPAFAQYTLKTLTSFNGANGQYSLAGVILSGSTLYGTTDEGGANGEGEVFSLPVTGGTPTVLASFAANGSNGQNPEAGVILSGSTLYGTTFEGGANGWGEVFSVPTAGGTPTVLTSFTFNNGAYPTAGVILSGSTLYGTTSNGAGPSGGSGEVFSLPATGGSPTVLWTFTGNSNPGPGTSSMDGAIPVSGVALSGNTLYGTTESGGTYNPYDFSNNTYYHGVVYSVPISGGSDTVLTSFNGSNGDSPQGGVTLSHDGGTLYGTTAYGGANDDGEVFSLPVGGGTPTILASFNGSNGSNPYTDLILSPDGTTLFGTTQQGGAYGNGEVFSVPVTGGTPTVLYSFTGGADGLYPHGDLIMDANGDLFGTTEASGANGDGTVFELAVPEPTSLVPILLPAMLLRRVRRSFI